MPLPEPSRVPASALVLLARASITQAATSEMEALVLRMAASGHYATVTYAFIEQGTPTLQDVLRDLARGGYEGILLLPLLVPMEPGLRVWLGRALQRWREASPNEPLPVLRVAPSLGTLPASDALLAELAQHAAESEPLSQPAATAAAGSVVPVQKHRVLVCQGGPCNEAGAAVLWGHLRNEQKRLDLRTTGDGVMTCKTTCLGPCGLAPVFQVFPKGTYYGGLDEVGIDRIVQEHLLGGRVVEDLAYYPSKQRQRLRAPSDFVSEPRLP